LIGCLEQAIERRKSFAPGVLLKFGYPRADRSRPFAWIDGITGFCRDISRLRFRLLNNLNQLSSHRSAQIRKFKFYELKMCLSISVPDCI